MCGNRSVAFVSQVHGEIWESVINCLLRDRQGYKTNRSWQSQQAGLRVISTLKGHRRRRRGFSRSLLGGAKTSVVVLSDCSA